MTAIAPVTAAASAPDAAATDQALSLGKTNYCGQALLKKGWLKLQNFSGNANKQAYAYLAEFLLEKGYTAHGVKRRSSSFNTQRVDHIYQDTHVDNVTLVSLTSAHDDDYISLTVIARIRNPDEPKDVVQNWLRNRATVAFLRLLEKINTTVFKGVEFDSFNQLRSLIEPNSPGLTAPQQRHIAQSLAAIEA